MKSRSCARTFFPAVSLVMPRAWLAVWVALFWLACLAWPGFVFAAPASAIPEQDAPHPGQGPADGMPVFGKITAISSASLQIQNVNGENMTIKFTDKTEFRKDRQPAKRTDFKVGDIIVVRGQENADHSWTAEIIAARSMNGLDGRGGGRGFGGPGGPGGRGESAQQNGTLGKDFVAGEIKSVAPPKLSVLRTDNVSQTLELNEDTSLRKGRESITMADIQSGDHVFARGALENNVFVPKMVIIIGAEQWKRMQEWSAQGGGQRRRGGSAGGAAGTPNTAPDSGAAPNTAGAPGSGGAASGAGGSSGQKPPEPQH
jgi:Domain of unknown function (DUF5666)